MRELDYLGFNIYIYIILYEKKLYVYRIGLLGLDYFFVKLIPNQNPDFFKMENQTGYLRKLFQSVNPV